MTLPRKLNLGFGNVVKVEAVARSTIQTLGGQDTEAWWCTPPTDSPFVGIIYIDKSLSLARQKESLYHELLHGCVDIFQSVVDENRNR
jgi:hypothetical protein